MQGFPVTFAKLKTDKLFNFRFIDFTDQYFFLLSVMNVPSYQERTLQVLNLDAAMKINRVVILDERGLQDVP